jgi:hypothetical protein
VAILTILFIVFFILWLASLFPAAGERFGPYGGWLPWICVGLLAWHVGMFRALH